MGFASVFRFSSMTIAATENYIVHYPYRILSLAIHTYIDRVVTYVDLGACPIAGFDTSVHISEEARNAPRAVPFAILSATLVSATLGWSRSHSPWYSLSTRI